MEILKRLSSWFYKVSTGWVALTGLIIFLLFTGLVLPGQAARTELSSEEVGSPDLSFTYSPSQLYEMAEAYGELGRATYIRSRFTFDLIWPLVYTLFLSTTISWIFNRAFSSGSVFRWANLAPFLGMAFDFAENISTALVMYRYPSPTNILATIAPIFTAAKWIFVTGSFVLLLIGIIAMIWQSLKKRLGESS